MQPAVDTQAGPAVIVIQSPAVKAERVDAIICAERERDVRGTRVVAKDRMIAETAGHDTVNFVSCTRENWSTPRLLGDRRHEPRHDIDVSRRASPGGNRASRRLPITETRVWPVMCRDPKQQ